MKRTNREYYLTVEGETEKWYFEHLQLLINQDASLPCTVKFKIKLHQSIYKAAKTIAAPWKVIAFHICDYESNAEMHVKNFNKVLEELRTVKNINKNVLYKLGYSNFSFELWMIIHKCEGISVVTNRKNYIKGINSAYHTNFQCIDEYKIESNFKNKVLTQIQLNDIVKAIENGKKIRKRHEENNDEYKMYGKFQYYTEAPDMTIHNCVEQILKDCEIIK